LHWYGQQKLTAKSIKPTQKRDRLDNGRLAKFLKQIKAKRQSSRLDRNIWAKAHELIQGLYIRRSTGCNVNLNSDKSRICELQRKPDAGDTGD